MTSKQFYQEQWLARRLGLPFSWDAGATTAEQRREAIRAAVLAAGAEAPCGRAGTITLGAAFERVYEEGP
jgi:hypothetical protein